MGMGRSARECGRGDAKEMHALSDCSSTGGIWEVSHLPVACAIGMHGMTVE